jgi:hypothetical protein
MIIHANIRTRGAWEPRRLGASSAVVTGFDVALIVDDRITESYTDVTSN